MLSFNQLTGQWVSDNNGNTTIGTSSSANTNPRLPSGTTGALNNTAVGYGALQFNTEGQHNIAIGVNALRRTSGDNNVAIGENALYNFQQPNVGMTGNRNVAIGNNTNGSNYNDCILLGNNAMTQDNAMLGLGGLNVVSTTGAPGTVSFLKTMLNGGNTGGLYYIPLCSTNALGGETGPTGPAGGLTGITGGSTGDYIYWNSTTWVVGGAQIQLGSGAGQMNQGANAVALGFNAGARNQGQNAIAIGSNAGRTGQASAAIAVGGSAGLTNQGINAVAIGPNAGETNQGDDAVAIGRAAGSTGQQQFAIAIGQNAGNASQALGAVAVGFQAGQTGQGQNAVAVGASAGDTSQGQNAVAIGASAGFTGQGVNAVAVGNNAGNTGQQDNAVAVGQGAGFTSQGTQAVAVGQGAGATNQGARAIAIGFQAGASNQGIEGISIGARINQQTGNQTIAIGSDSVADAAQNVGAIAIGFQACKQGQGNYSIHIGYRNPQPVIQPANSILLNATGDGGSGGLPGSFQSVANGFCVAPVRNVSGASGGGGVYYNNVAKEFTWDTGKTFIIDHPLDPANKHLVHACLEGPEAGVYYRGKGEIVNGSFVEVQLPSYVGALCTDLTVQITHIYDGAVKVFSASEVDTAANTFTVHGENGRFNWLVHGKRGDVTVEPNKADVTVRGDGPYKYIM